MANSIHELFQKASPMERLQVFNGGVYMSLTSKCNARCRHCITEDEDPIMVDADYESVLNWIEQIHASGLKVVHFVGGEPFVVRKKLNDYVKKLGELGMYSSVVTNGFWAKTVEEGIAVLEEMPNLNILILSSDKYHLEYIDAQTIKNAIEAALATDKFVVINATYVEKQEVKEINEIYKEYRNKVFIQSVKAMPFGGAASLGISRDPLFQTPNKVPAFCNIGNYFVDVNGEVTACCQASRSSTKYLCVGDLQQEKMPEMVARFTQSKIYNFIRQRGPRGLIELFAASPYGAELMERQYTGACEICLDLLDNQETLDYFLAQLAERSA